MTHKFCIFLSWFGTDISIIDGSTPLNAYTRLAIFFTAEEIFTKNTVYAILDRFVMENIVYDHIQLTKRYYMFFTKIVSIFP